MNRALRLPALAVLTALAACSGSASGPSTGTQVTFNLATTNTALGALRGDTIPTTGTDTLVVDSVQLVLREIKFQRTNEDVCDQEDSLDSGSLRLAFSHDGESDGDNNDNDGENDGNDGHADGCESFNAGPYLLDLPLGAGVVRGFSVAVDTGSYDQLRIKIHKPENGGSDPKDAAFLAAHPEFDGVSIRAFGTFNGAAFAFTTDLDARQEMDLIPPVIVADSATNVDITINVDLTTWFSDGAGGLVDPNTGNKGGSNDNLVNDNIRGSFHAFRDEDRDGHDGPGDED